MEKWIDQMKTTRYLKDERDAPLDIISKCLAVGLLIYVLTGGVMAYG